jgi:DNA topoisomerase-1
MFAKIIERALEMKSGRPPAPAAGGAGKTPAAKKSAAKKPAVKKPAVKTSAAKKPTAKKRAT